MTTSVVLGHVVPSGERFHIPIAHTVITGITQQGKTTAEEAIFSRLSQADSKEYKVLVFLTKRGEKTFQNAHCISPFYRERFDWEYVRSLLESSMKERLKFETPWIIRICKLAEVELANRGVDVKHLPPGEGLKAVRKLLGNILTKEKLRDFDRNIYTLLAAYLDKVLPVLETAQIKFVDHLDLQPGINVMDLTEWYTHEEVQMLVIRSCMEEILKSLNDTLIVLPEAWKMLPQGRNTPVKLIFEKYVREGATNNNYLYLDAQDLGGMDKVPLRQVSVWIMGRMLEANEVKRLLNQTLGVDVKPEEIQTLPLGHFLVAAADKVTKVYVWPEGIPEDVSVDVAKGKIPATAVQTLLQGIQKIQQESPMGKAAADAAKFFHGEFSERDNRIEALSRRLDTLTRRVDELPSMPSINANGSVDGSAQLTQKTMTISVEKAVVEFTLTTQNVGGKIMWLAKEGFLNAWKSQKEIEDELANRGWGAIRITVYKSLEMLVNQGFIGSRKSDRMQFKLAPFVTFKEES